MLKILQKSKSFWYHRLFLRDFNPNSWEIFSLEVPVMDPVILNFHWVFMKWGIMCFITYDVAIIKMGYNKWFICCNQWRPSWIFCRFHNNSIVLLILLSLSLRCYWKSSLVSKIIPWCLWWVIWFIKVAGKSNFLCLFLGIRIKIYFSLKTTYVFLL